MSASIYLSEAVVRRCSVKKVFLEISQNSQENTCEAYNFIKKESLAQAFTCEFCGNSKKTFFYRTAPVTASGMFKVNNRNSRKRCEVCSKYFQTMLAIKNSKQRHWYLSLAPSYLHLFLVFLLVNVCWGCLWHLWFVS